MKWDGQVSWSFRASIGVRCVRNYAAVWVLWRIRSLLWSFYVKCGRIKSHCHLSFRPGLSSPEVRRLLGVHNESLEYAPWDERLLVAELMPRSGMLAEASAVSISLWR